MSNDAQFEEHDQADDEFQCTIRNLKPKLFTQMELNDLGLTKEKAKPLATRLKEKKIMAEGTNIYAYRRREQQFSQSFQGL